MTAIVLNQEVIIELLEITKVSPLISRWASSAESV